MVAITGTPKACASRRALPTASFSEGRTIRSMQGTILKILVEKGDKVEEGKPVAVIEAMKMESEILADHSGEVKDVFIAVGDMVATGDVIMQIL